MNIILSNSSGVPIYEQIFNSFKHAIIADELHDNEPLPSIRMLAGNLKVSVITTKRAYDELERQGFIYTLQGKGSFVSPKNLDLIRESKLNEMEEKLLEVIEIADTLGLSLKDITDMVKTLKEI
ncbi:MAG: GntR family transcriptional regulator [Clostridium sp.]